MPKYRDLNAPPKQQLADIVAGLRDRSTGLVTGATGVQHYGQYGDAVWTRPDGSEHSVRDIDADLEGARDRIAEAEQDLAQTQVRLDDAEQTITTVSGDLDTLETVTLPNAVDALEQADQAAQQELGILDGKIVSAQQDLDTAENNITVLQDDLLAETAAREDLAADMQGTFNTLDGRLDTAFPSGVFDVSAELAQTIRDSVVEYAVGASETVPPTSGWSTATPTRADGEFIWFRTVITYADDTTATSSPALLTGNAGEQGPPGEDGTGVTIKGSFDSEAELPASGADGDAYLIGGDLYVWNSVSGGWENVGRIQGPKGEPGAKGDDGAPGPAGVSVTSITPFYQRLASSASAPAKPTTMTPNGWASVEPAWVVDTTLWRTERVVYSNDSFAYTPVTKVAVFAGIDAAMTAANGKNAITYSDLPDQSKPGPPPAVDYSRTPGDIHRNRRESTGEIWAEYQWTGTAWRQVSFGNEVLTSLDVGKLSAGTATIQAGVIDQLWADGIAAKSIATSQLVVSPDNMIPDPGFADADMRQARMTHSRTTAGPSWVGSGGLPGVTNRLRMEYNGADQRLMLGATDAMGETPVVPGQKYRMSVDVRGTGRIGWYWSFYYTKTDGTVSSEWLATSVHVDQWGLVEDVVTLPDDAVRVTAALRANAGGATGDRLTFAMPVMTPMVGAVLIEDGAVGADQVRAEEVAGVTGQFIELETSQLRATDSIVTPEGVIDKLWTDGLVSKSVATSQLIVSPDNMIADSGFADPDLMDVRMNATWTTTPRLTWTGSGAVPGAVNRIRFTDTSTATRLSLGIGDDGLGGEIRVQPGKTYAFSVDARGGGGATWLWQFDTTAQDGTRAVLDGTATTDRNGRIEDTVTFPDDVVRVTPAIFVTGGGSGTMDFGAPRMVPLVGSVLIEDGAITTPKLTVTEEMSGKIANFLTVNAAEGVFTKGFTAANATLVGQTVVDDINVQGKLIGTDGVFTGTVDFANINVTNEVLASKISGEYLYGTVVEGGEFRTSNTLSGQVILSDDGYVDSGSGATYPGIRVIPPDLTGIDTPPGIGALGKGMFLNAGRTTTGERANVYLGEGRMYVEGSHGAEYSFLTVENEHTWMASNDGTGNSGRVIAKHNYAQVRTDAADGSYGVVETANDYAVVATRDPAGNYMSHIRSNGREAYLWSTGSDGLGRVLSVDSDGVWVKTQRDGTWKHYNLEDTAQDSGWASLGVFSGLTSNGSPAYRNKGGVIWLRGWVTLSSGSWSAGWTQIAQIPSESSPATALRRPAAIPGTGGAVLQVGSTGLIQIYLPTTLVGATEIHLGGLFYPLG